MFERNTAMIQLLSRKKYNRKLAISPTQIIEETVCLPLEEPLPIGSKTKKQQQKLSLVPYVHTPKFTEVRINLLF